MEKYDYSELVSQQQLPLYGRAVCTEGIPKTSIPDNPMAPDTAYQIIKDELALDGTPALNFATFVNTWVDDWAKRLATENLGKNFIDHEEYPQSNLVEKRIIWMLGELYGTKFKCCDTDPDTATGYYGSATIGSSEAVMLGLIAHRKNWQTNNKNNPNRCPLDRPFIILSTHAQTCWDKYCKYFDVGALYIEPKEENDYGITGEQVGALLNTTIGAYKPINENDPTIQKFCEYPEDYPGLQSRTVGELVSAVGAIVGTTYAGCSDRVGEINAAVDSYCQAHMCLKVDIPIHVDAASGGFILPFVNPQTKKPVPFNFRHGKRIQSINVSNHKFGMTIPGMGSVVFRDTNVVPPPSEKHPDSLIYDISYLGGSFYDYTVNFSRGSAAILAQYHVLLHWGKAGYQAVINNTMANAKRLLKNIRESCILGKLFTPISDNEHYPICVFQWVGGKTSWTLTEFTEGLRRYNWIVPNYKLPTTNPESPDGAEVFRVVVRQMVTANQIDSLTDDMEQVIKKLKCKKKVSRVYPPSRV